MLGEILQERLIALGDLRSDIVALARLNLLAARTSCSRANLESEMAPM